MMPFLSAPETRFLTAVGWSLLHLVWQAALVGAIAAIALQAAPNAKARYALLCSAFAALAVCPFLTLVGMQKVLAHPSQAGLLHTPVVSGQTSIVVNPDNFIVHNVFILIREVHAWLPAFALLWILCVGLHLSRIAVGLARLRTLRLKSRAVDIALFNETVERLAASMGIRQKIGLLVSQEVGVLS